MKTARILIIACLLPAASAVSAAGISIEPGLWETTSTINMPMMAQPQVKTMTQCMEDGEFSMDDFQPEETVPQCSFSMDQVDGNTMKWSVDCPVDGGGKSHGEWEATSSGDSVTGKGILTMSFQGQSMEMTMEWSGKRIGDCP